MALWGYLCVHWSGSRCLLRCPNMGVHKEGAAWLVCLLVIQLTSQADRRLTTQASNPLLQSDWQTGCASACWRKTWVWKRGTLVSSTIYLPNAISPRKKLQHTWFLLEKTLLTTLEVAHNTQVAITKSVGSIRDIFDWQSNPWSVFLKEFDIPLFWQKWMFVHCSILAFRPTEATEIHTKFHTAVGLIQFHKNTVSFEWGNCSDWPSKVWQKIKTDLQRLTVMILCCHQKGNVLTTKNQNKNGNFSQKKKKRPKRNLRMIPRRAQIAFPPKAAGTCTTRASGVCSAQ